MHDDDDIEPLLHQRGDGIVYRLGVGGERVGEGDVAVGGLLRALGLEAVGGEEFADGGEVGGLVPGAVDEEDGWWGVGHGGVGIVVRELRVCWYYGSWVWGRLEIISFGERLFSFHRRWDGGGE